MAVLALCSRTTSSILRASLYVRPSLPLNRCLISFSATPLLAVMPTQAAGSRLRIEARCRIREDDSGRARQFARRFSMRASSGLSPGTIDSPLIASMQAKIKEQLNAEEVLVVDASGDGRHVSIDVVATAFEGVSAVNRQRMVYKAIWEELQDVVHAVDQLRTRTPEEVAKAKSQS